MWGIGGKGQGQGDKKEKRTNGLVVVAIDKDKGSQYALKWAAEHLMSRGQTIVLLHINSKAQSIPNPMGNNVSISDVKEEVAATYRQQLDSQMKELFLPFRCFCTRKEIHCKDVVLDDPDISKAITEFVSHQGVDNLVLGASSRGAFARRFKSTDVPTSVSKGVPDFCTVFVIAKGKISSIRSAVRQAPTSSPLRTSILGLQSQTSIKLDQSNNAARGPKGGSNLDQRTLRRDIYMDNRGLQPDAQAEQQILQHELESMKSPFLRGSKASNIRFADLSGTDISFVSSGRPSSDRSSDFMDPNTPRLSSGSEAFDFRSSVSSTPHKRQSSSFVHDHSMVSQESGGSMWSPERMDDLDAEMRRLKLELKQTMDMYSAACKEALNAKQKARELHLWKLEEEQRLEESRLAGEAALAIAENEKLKSKAAMEAAEAAQRIAELEAQKRMNAEMKALKEAEEKKKAMDALAQSDTRYRRYSIEEIEEATEYFADFRKIGEGGYGPVYKCYLDHTPVAIKVLRPDAAQGRSQFQQEVQVLSRMRHPNMVLLLGACPEYGCLVYEYMANGSLEDRLFQRGNTPVLPWQLRFRIAAEIGTGLLFLHQNKPEPLVHRDLKPANILLDRNYVSKISDVGLARLVPPSVANNVTQYHMTSAAGTFCYIDPEYQQTGMLGTKSDIYSLGIMLLQIITAKPPMGLAHFVERAIEKGTFAELLDPAVPDWPVEETLTFAKISLCCVELRRKDRPDLGSVVLPVLQKLASLADDYTFPGFLGGSSHASPNHSNASLHQDVMSDLGHSGYESRSSTSSIPGRQSFVKY